MNTTSATPSSAATTSNNCIVAASVTKRTIGINNGEDLPLPKRAKKTISNDPVDAIKGFNASSNINNATDFHLQSIKPPPLLPRDCKHILLDIEGCTTAISFVKDVLFPFARENLNLYLDSLLQNDEECNEKWDQILQELKLDVEKLEKDHPSKILIHQKLERQKIDDIKSKIQLHVEALMDHDVKATGLKSLQGQIWNHGYCKTQQLKGHVYSDFVPFLTWCEKCNISVNIYSSGSIHAQKLLFTHSQNGNLCSYFHQHFDTTSGNKKESSSYTTIAKALDVDIKELCFVSDAEAELVAARAGGVGFVVMSVRPGNVPLTDTGHEFPIIYSLLQLCGDED